MFPNEAIDYWNRHVGIDLFANVYIECDTNAAAKSR
jgi:hypothetical protein